MKRLLPTLPLLFGTLTLLLGGCSGSGKGPVIKGTVTLDGKPLDHAEVAFEPIERGSQIGGDIVKTDENGQFEIVSSSRKHGLKPGKYYAKVSKWVDKKTGKLPDPGTMEGIDADQLRMAGKLKNVVPDRYSSSDFPGGLFQVEVKAGDNDLKIDLTSKRR